MTGAGGLSFLKSVASPIELADVPASWRSAPLVLLGPLAGEVGYELAASFPEAVVLASIQGWLRQWGRSRSREPHGLGRNGRVAAR